MRDGQAAAGRGSGARGASGAETKSFRRISATVRTAASSAVTAAIRLMSFNAVAKLWRMAAIAGPRCSAGSPARAALT